MKKNIFAPPEFFLELSSLLRALKTQESNGELTLETRDAMYRVISHIKHMEVKNGPRRVRHWDDGGAA